MILQTRERADDRAARPPQPFGERGDGGLKPACLEVDHPHQLAQHVDADRAERAVTPAGDLVLAVVDLRRAHPRVALGLVEGAPIALLALACAIAAAADRLARAMPLFRLAASNLKQRTRAHERLASASEKRRTPRLPSLWLAKPTY